MPDATGDPDHLRLLDGGRVVTSGPAAIELAARLLRAGEVVAIPTDTVYGLAAALDRPDALDGIMGIKGRPDGKSLPILLASADALGAVSGTIPPGGSCARLVTLARALWPGALTVAVPAASRLPAQVIANDGTAGVRVPDDPTTRALLRAAGGTLAVTSANRSGQPTPATAGDIAAALGSHGLRWVLDGGHRTGGSPSTVIGLDGDELVVHRAGGLPVAGIRAVWEATDRDGSDQDD